MLDYYSISALIGLLTEFGMGIFVYLKNKQRSQNRAYAVACFTLGVWALSDFLLSIRLPLDNNLYLVMIKFLSIGVMFFPSALARFGLALVDESPGKYFKYFLNYFPILLWLLTIFTPYVMKELVLEETKFYTRYFPRGGSLYNVFILFTVWSIYYWLYKLSYNYKRTTGLKRNQIKYFLIASSVGFLSVPIVFLNIFGIEVLPIDNFIVAGYLLIITYAIVKHRLMDIQVAFSKSLVAILLGAGVIGFDILFVKLLHPVIGYYFSGAIAMLIIGGVLFATPLSRKLQLGMDQMVLGGKYNYQNILREASRTVLTILNLNELVSYIVSMLRQSLGVEKIAILLKDVGCRAVREPPLQGYKLQYGYGVEEQMQNGYEIKGGIIDMNIFS